MYTKFLFIALALFSWTNVSFAQDDMYDEPAKAVLKSARGFGYNSEGEQQYYDDNSYNDGNYNGSYASRLDRMYGTSYSRPRVTMGFGMGYGGFYGNPYTMPYYNPYYGPGSNFSLSFGVGNGFYNPYCSNYYYNSWNNPFFGSWGYMPYYPPIYGGGFYGGGYYGGGPYPGGGFYRPPVVSNRPAIKNPPRGFGRYNDRYRPAPGNTNGQPRKPTYGNNNRTHPPANNTYRSGSESPSGSFSSPSNGGFRGGSSGGGNRGRTGRF